MKTKNLQVLAALAVVTLLALTPVASAQGQQMQYQYSQGMARITTDEIGVRVTAFNQVPHFHWWNNTSNDTDYHLIFLRLMEVNDTDDDGTYVPGTDSMIGDPYVLPTANWEFSGFETEEEGSTVTAIHFNFTTTETFSLPNPPGNPEALSLQPSEFDVTMQIRVHLYSADPQELKFDVVISGWEWTSEDSLLVLHFSLSESAHGNQDGTDGPPEFVKEGKQYKFGDGYMKYEEEAQVGNETSQETIQVRASDGDGSSGQAGNSVYLAFEYFGNETMEYDPTLGIASVDGDGSLIPTLGTTELILICAGIGIVVLALVIWKVRS